jgi:hypothetical protein
VAEETGVLPWWGERWHKPFFALFVIALAVGLASPYLGPERAALWTDILAFLALLSALATLGRQLPFQNVVIIAFLVSAGCAGWTFVIDHFHGGTFDSGGVVLWTAIVLNARGAAQFLMRRWRDVRLYGWAIFGIAAALAAIFAGILYSDLTRVVVAGLATLLILLISFPLFMNKRPAEVPLSSQPVFVSTALLVWLLIHSTD